MNDFYVKSFAAFLRRFIYTDTSLSLSNDAFCYLICLRYAFENGYFPSTITSDNILQTSDALCLLFEEEIPAFSENWQKIWDQLLDVLPASLWKNNLFLPGELYQQFNGAAKDEAYGLRQSKQRVQKENITAATQLFTPSWIARYLAENSIGRLWIDRLKLNDPSLDEAEAASSFGWMTYIPRPEAIIPNQPQIPIHPQYMHIIDPCVGSGNLLLESFDVCMSIYRSCGWNTADAAVQIVTKNLYGLDIDETVCRLARFVLRMKVFDHGGYVSEKALSRQIFVIRDKDYFRKQGTLPTLNKGRKSVQSYLHLLENAREYGSLLCPPQDVADTISLEPPFDEFTLQAHLLSKRYHVVLTNPPYMNSNGVSQALSFFLKSVYPENKHDLCAAFITRCLQMTKQGGYLAMLTQHSWLFLSSFESLRHYLLQKDLVNMLHLGSQAFEGFGGEVVQTAAFVICQSPQNGYSSVFVRLTKAPSAAKKQQVFESGACRMTAKTDAFVRLPGAPYAYWVDKPTVDAYDSAVTWADVSHPCQGMATGNNARFLRLWHEVPFDRIGLDIPDAEQAAASGCRWFPYNKGGAFRKWYGNRLYVVDWEQDGQRLRRYRGSILRNQDGYFKACVTWSKISGKGLSMRYSPPGSLFDVAGCSLFGSGETLWHALCFFNSSVCERLLSVISPTLNCEVGHIAALPYKPIASSLYALAEENVRLCKQDWDSFEISWDFRHHPLCDADSVQDAFIKWENGQLQAKERLEINESCIESVLCTAYGLPVLKRSVTDSPIRLADRERDVKSLLSYALGCMMGRYSVDTDGLILAGNAWDSRIYGSFQPCHDGIVMICNRHAPHHDIVDLLEKLLCLWFSKTNLETNLQFIADSLPPFDGDARQTIRHYYYRYFFEEHLKIYQNRPLYARWDGGRGSGLRVLIYLFRFTGDTPSALIQQCVEPWLTMTGESAVVRRHAQKLQDFCEPIPSFEEGLSAVYKTLSPLFPSLIKDRRNKAGTE